MVHIRGKGGERETVRVGALAGPGVKMRLAKSFAQMYALGLCAFAPERHGEGEGRRAVKI